MGQDSCISKTLLLPLNKLVYFQLEMAANSSSFSLLSFVTFRKANHYLLF